MIFNSLMYNTQYMRSHLASRCLRTAAPLLSHEKDCENALRTRVYKCSMSPFKTLVLTNEITVFVITTRIIQLSSHPWH